MDALPVTPDPRARMLTLPFCLAGIALCTWISFRFHQNLASAGFLYLIFVVLAALNGGPWHATLISIVSVACLDYFFDDPVFSFTVGRLSNWVELAAFEFTALVVSRLSRREQLRAAQAHADRCDTTLLYETARRILLTEKHADIPSVTARLIQARFELTGAFVFDAADGVIYESGTVPEATDRDAFFSSLRGVYCTGKGVRLPGQRFSVLRVGTRPVGSIAFCGRAMSDLIAEALASLCAVALERAHSLEAVCHAEATIEAEQLRAALLDALAHKFKTPLAVIRTALAGVPVAGTLSSLQSDLVALADQETRKLNDLAHRIVGGSEPEPSENIPQAEPLLLSRLLRTAIEETGQREDHGRFRLSRPQEEPPILADRELILTALSHLLDNALKYSIPESAIDVNVSVQEQGLLLSVKSQGLAVNNADRERIFERYYRADDARSHAAGSGLGLSIVKTIAADHQGHVWAQGEPGFGTTFFLSLPFAHKVFA